MLVKQLQVVICLTVLQVGFLGVDGAKAGPIAVVPIPRTAVLEPTANAPVDASGVASFLSPAADLATNLPDLHVTTVFLLGGDYTVNITDTASNVYTLGTFSVPTFTNQNIDAVPVGQGSFALPDGLNPTNVADVSIMDSNEVVDLAGTFHGPIALPPPMVPKVLLLTPTNDAPIHATGRALLIPVVSVISSLPAGNDDSNGVLYSTGTGYYFGELTVTNTVLGIADGSGQGIINIIGSGSYPGGSTPTNLLIIPPFASLTGSNQLVLVSNAAPVAEVSPEPSTSVAGTGSVLIVETTGLAAGPYTVSLTDNTGSNTFTLGTFEETTRTNLLNYATPMLIIFGQSNTTGQAVFALPTGLNPTNVATISVIDSNSVIEMTGDFEETTNSMRYGFNTVSALVPGPACTNLQGTASLKLQTNNGKAHNLFLLTAQGAPAHGVFNLIVNGVSVGTVKSNKHGKINLKHLPKGVDLTNVLTLEADDSQSNVVFSVSF